ncbi:hypothetical protein BZA77DRAFT_46350 [Pyronema omphalodes]|nr:hypothetical protein BZA77DRAFT_46350 [Pyronema omphalodes]
MWRLANLFTSGSLFSKLLSIEGDSLVSIEGIPQELIGALYFAFMVPWEGTHTGIEKWEAQSNFVNHYWICTASMCDSTMTSVCLKAFGVV